MKKISICIPTYNRERYLIELLNSVKKQLTEENAGLIEICISDNYSNDETEQSIKNYAKYFPAKIIYHRNSENIGPDLNYLKAVSIATGSYCWLMGSDDILPPNVIDRILLYINNNSDISIFLGNRTVCDENANPIFDQKWLRIKTQNPIFDFIDEKNFIQYFNYCNSIGGVFSYLSSIVVKRTDWGQIEYDNSYTGTAYSHVFYLISILKSKKKLLYINDMPIIHCRGGNDFFNKNRKQRYFLDFEGYHKLFNDIFENKNISCAGLKILTREHGILKLLRLCADYPLYSLEINFLHEFGYSKFSLFIIKVVSTHNRIYKQFFYKLLKPYRLILSLKRRTL